jgi:hypothetical protein
VQETCGVKDTAGPMAVPRRASDRLWKCIVNLNGRLDTSCSEVMQGIK